MKRTVLVSALMMAVQVFPPTGSAVAQSSPYVFPVQGCTTTYAHSHHDYPATDILLAGKHSAVCYFVAPTSGVIDEVNRTDHFNWKTDKGAQRGGLSISMVGVDGVRYYGSHLKLIEATLAPGVHVVAGDHLGILGNSGDARGLATHLHFGISWPTAAGAWWIRRGEVYPWRYLNAWRKGMPLNPASAVRKIHATLGDLPPCRKGC